MNTWKLKYKRNFFKKEIQDFQFTGNRKPVVF